MNDTLSPIRIVVAAVVLSLASAGVGYYVASAHFDAAIEAETIRIQEANLELLKQVQAQDDKRAATDAAKIKELEGERNATINQTSPGIALDADDVERLRKFFRDSAEPAAAATSKGANSKPRKRTK